MNLSGSSKPTIGEWSLDIVTFASRVVFTNSSNPFIQARADAVHSIIPAAIFRNMMVQPGGLDGMFEKPNGVLDATKRIYVGSPFSVSAEEARRN
jgi:hypothetical protein